MSDPTFTHDLHNREDIVLHLAKAHGWNPAHGSPDDPAMHNAAGGWLVPTPELLAIHAELTLLEPPQHQVPKR